MDRGLGFVIVRDTELLKAVHFSNAHKALKKQSRTFKQELDFWLAYFGATAAAAVAAVVQTEPGTEIMGTGAAIFLLLVLLSLQLLLHDHYLPKA